MKARSCPVVLSLALGLVAFACARAADAPAPTMSFVDPDDPAVTEIRRLGERTVDQVGGALLVEVRRTLNNTEPAFAVGLLHLKNYKLPDPIPGQPAVTAVARTSIRVRNPLNAPDDADRAALDHIKSQFDQGDAVSRVLIQKIDVAGKPTEWRVYRPLAIMDQCMVCHGPASLIEPGVLASLKQFFPGDNAVDYVPGEWRGLLRVSIAAPVPAK